MRRSDLLCASLCSLPLLYSGEGDERSESGEGGVFVVCIYPGVHRVVHLCGYLIPLNRAISLHSNNFDVAMRLAEVELERTREAVSMGNEGRARVCARRAVAAFIQQIAPERGMAAGTNALANLRFLQEQCSLPDEIRQAACRLLGGARSILAAEPYSTDPLADARLIIDYYVRSGD